MQFFLDTGLIEEVEEAQSLGLLDGLTTNPSLVAQSGKSREALAREILGRVEGPVSLEVISAEFDGMIQEAKALAAIQENVVVKLPLTTEGIKACRWCTASGIKTNVTLCFSLAGALMAAKNGATYISPFVGRIDDIGQDGLALLAHIKQTYDHYGFSTKILAASMRTIGHVEEAALIGVQAATMPLAVMKKLFHHPLTTIGLSKFLADHQKASDSL